MGELGLAEGTGTGVRNDRRREVEETEKETGKEIEGIG